MSNEELRIAHTTRKKKAHCRIASHEIVNYYGYEYCQTEESILIDYFREVNRYVLCMMVLAAQCAFDDEIVDRYSNYLLKDVRRDEQ